MPGEASAASGRYAGSAVVLHRHGGLQTATMLGKHERRMIGPFEVLSFQQEVASYGAHVQYSVTIAGSERQWSCRCRYRDLLHLRRDVEEALDELSQPLPPMPPKSFLRKRCLRSFMENRRAALERLLCAILHEDSHGRSKPVRRFLGLGLAPTTSGLGVSETMSTFCGGSSSTMMIIKEGDEDDDVWEPDSEFEYNEYSNRKLL